MAYFKIELSENKEEKEWKKISFFNFHGLKFKLFQMHQYGV